MIEGVLDHLRVLVADDTTNPPRRITPGSAALAHARRVLEGAGFSVEIDDLGEGSVNLHARRGEPEIVFNCHLDTVPPDDCWDGDPFALGVEGERAVGLGACDIKGAAACLLAAATQSEGAAAILFTTDEEAGDARCVRTFMERAAAQYTGVVVAEPTGCNAVAAHRGIVSADVVFTGKGGHASAPGGRSAIHDLVEWANACVNSDRCKESRFNVGRIEGGEKANMVASRASARFGLRPPPGTSISDAMDLVRSFAPAGAQANWTERFLGEPLTEAPASCALAARLGLETAPPVDFWTEAAVFAHAGLPSIVFGPGDITQAHTAGEFVELDQLERATGVYAGLFAGAEHGAPA